MMALARASPIFGSVASSFSEALFKSIKSPDLALSDEADEDFSDEAADLAGAEALASSMAWATPMPSSASAALNKTDFSNVVNLFLLVMQSEEALRLSKTIDSPKTLFLDSLS